MLRLSFAAEGSIFCLIYETNTPLGLLALLGMLAVLLWLGLSGTDTPSQREGAGRDLAPASQARPGASQPSANEALDDPETVVSGGLLLYFEDESTYRAYLAELAVAGRSPIASIDGLLTLQLDEATLQEHSPKQGGVRLGSNYRMQSPVPPELVHPEALARLRAYGLPASEIVGDMDSGGAGVRVAILDSGLMEHAQFAQTDIEVLDYTESGVDGEGAAHGTSVASIIGGAQGIAPDATLLVMRVLGADGSGTSFDVASAIVDAVDADADIINLSLGLYVDTQVLRNAVAYAEQQGVLLVAAAGNEGYSGLAYPAAYESVIAVTAVDAEGRQAIFPNQSEAIDFAAPGVGILTAQEAMGTSSFTGTSAAAPFVTGTLATLLASASNPIRQQAVELMTEYLNEAGAPGVDAAYGAGVVDWQRLRERDQDDVVDLALASVTLGRDAQAGTTMPVEITVQNRGTEWLYGAQLDVALGAQEPQQFELEVLAPGKTTTREVTALPPANQEAVELRIVATVQPEDPQRDLRPENNFKAVQFVPND